MTRHDQSHVKTPDLTRKPEEYSGTCFVCLQPCETALGFMGEVPWVTGCLIGLGLPSGQAAMMVLQSSGGRGFVQQVYRLCVVCVVRSTGGWRFPIPGKPPVFPFMVQPEFLPGGEAIGVHLPTEPEAA